MDDDAETAARNVRHAERMRRKKEVVDEKIAAAGIHAGVLVVNTGNGKGKGSSGLQPGVEW